VSSPLRIVSVSGGKDSTALYLWAIEQWGKNGFKAMFADTGHEHPVTLNYLRNLPTMANGPDIKWVKADFSKRLEDKFNGRSQTKSKGGLKLIARLFNWLKGLGWTTSIPFLDLIIWKARVPSTKAQFCTFFLKLEPMKEYIESIRGDMEVENYVGIRADESPKRAKMSEQEFDEYFDCEVYRPLLRWTEEQVFAQLAKHGVPPNPLYGAGFSRVGCFPCIHARKSELARLPESAWLKLEEWERIVGSSWFPPGMIPLTDEQKVFVKANLKYKKEWVEDTTDVTGEVGDWVDVPDWDASPECMALIIPTTERAREWAKTTQGGKQYGMFQPDNADVPGCMSTWGACE
jgi:3'-phosphoadenosine 5'-phosphosulfate sulfotransferase (PAPS reductase)/FAD synthetase